MAVEQYLAEQAVLGSLLIDPEIMTEVARTVSLDDFLLEQNQKLYKAALMLYRLGEPVDAITIRNKVGNDFSEYMAELMKITPTSSNWAEYAKIMHEQATLARMKEQAQKILDAVELEECRPAAAAMEKLLSSGKKIDSWNMKQMMDDFFASQDPDAPKPEYITFGMEDIDSGTFAQRGDVVVLGGYPSAGKTAMALSMAYHMAKTKRVGFFSLETNKQKLRDRLVAMAAQVGLDKIKHHDLTEQDWKSVAAIYQPFVDRDFTVVPASGATVSDIAAMSKAFGFEVVFVDYLQLIRPELSRRGTRTEQIAEVSMALHIFAQESGTMVIELAQLLRQDKSNGWREPDMHDLKESGQIEQDADIIMMVYKPNPKDKDLTQDAHRIFKVAKNKEGRLGRWIMHFDGLRQTFTMAADETGRSVMQILNQHGKQVKARNRALADTNQMTFRELPEAENKNMPF